MRPSIDLATTLSCSRAAGRYTSTETSMGRCPPFFSHAASLPLVVVLPEPCKPAIKITVGGCDENLKRAVSVPSSVISSSRTILITCSEGESAVITDAAHRLHADHFDQVGDHLQVDVGVQQRHADLAQRFG